MIIKSFSDKIVLPSKRDVLRVHLYTKLMEKGIHPYDKDLEMLLELYMFGCYTQDTQKQFFDLCLEKEYKKTLQSVRNTLSKYVTLGILKKPRNKHLFLANDILPRVTFDLLVLEHKVTHADGLQTDIQGVGRENGQTGAAL